MYVKGKMNIPMNARSYRRQRGVVLFLAMIFLVLLTILAVTASSTSVMQERMTGGMRNLQLGLMGAESTVRGGEDVLWSIQFDAGSPLPPCISESDGSDCVYKPNPDGTLSPIVQRFRTSREWLDPATDGARPYPRNLTALSGTGETANLAEQPRFMIEFLGEPAGPHRNSGSKLTQKAGAKAGEIAIYRITARSQGGTDAVVRVAESYFSTMNLTNIGSNPDPAP